MHAFKIVEMWELVVMPSTPPPTECQLDLILKSWFIESNREALIERDISSNDSALISTIIREFESVWQFEWLVSGGEEYRF